MIETINFKTKTFNLERENPMVDGYWGMSLDIGYSGVKILSPNKVCCFPYYARKITQQMLSVGETNPTSIQYKDGQSSDIWLVGEAAISAMDVEDTKDSANALYGRNRYFSEMFLVCSRVGMALGMMPNKYGSYENKKLMVQTGLPPAYLKADSPLLKEALSGNHDFSIKVGNSKWVHFNFTLPESNIMIMPQPMGTLMSVASRMDGSSIPEAALYFKKKLIIFDGGFGTLDDFNISNGIIDSYETFDDLGMKRVMKETSERIFEKYHTEIPVLGMQKYLESGMVRCFNRKLRQTTNESFADILEKENEKVCREALARVDNIYNSFINHDYFVVAGGTGEAWYPIIKQYFKNMSTLTIIPGNQNDNLPYIFSNARGYYIYMLQNIKRQKKSS